MNTKHARSATCLSLGFALTSFTIPALHAGSYSTDFSTDPTLPSLPANERLEIHANAAAAAGYQATGGNPGGWLRLTGPNNDARSTIIFPDFESGFVVGAFTFGVDCRIGGGSGTPADGFSINFARPNDPVLVNQDKNTSYASDAHEEGTTTGIGICFDAYDSGNGDVVGFSVRVDNVVITQVPAATRNGAVDDATSLQTGPAGSIEGLGWARFEVELRTDGTLDVIWKGVKVIDNLATGYSPSAGRLIFGARTGGLNQAHHFDNLTLTTVAMPQAVVGNVQVSHAEGLTFDVTDYGTESVVTPDSLQALLIGGSIVTPSSATKTGSVTTFEYQSPVALPAFTDIPYQIILKDQANRTINSTGNVRTPFLELAPIITNTPILNLWDIKEVRPTAITPFDIGTAFRIAKNPPASAPVPSEYTAPFVNFSDDVNFGTRGFFKRDALFATSEPTVDDNNIVIAGRTKISVPEAGDYTFWVQSDDGFALRVNGSTFSKVAGPGQIDPSDDSTIGFTVGTGNADTRGLVSLPAGESTLDFLYFEGSGGAFVEVAWSKGDNVDNPQTGEWLLVGGDAETPYFPAGPLAGADGTTTAWAIQSLTDAPFGRTLRGAFSLQADPAAATVLETVSPVINFIDPENPGAPGLFNNELPFPSDTEADDEDFVTVGRFQFDAAEGDYSFGITADDGFAFRILGAPYLITSAGGGGIDPLDGSAVFHPGASGDTTFAVYRVPVAGVYTVEVLSHENAGGSSMEVIWAPGSFLTRGATSSWQLLGDASSIPEPTQVLGADVFASLAEPEPGAWSVRFYRPTTTIGNLQQGIAAALDPETPFFEDMPEYINYNDLDGGEGQIGGGGLFTAGNAIYQTPIEQEFPGSIGTDDNLVGLMTTRIVIPESGPYTFGIASDDGFALRILGTTSHFSGVTGGAAYIDPAAKNTVVRPGAGNQSSRAVIELAAGVYDVELAYYEGGGGAHVEIYTAAGRFPNDADSTLWGLIGAVGGLSTDPGSVGQVGDSITNFEFDPVNGGFSFDFPSDPSKSYRIEYSYNLEDWTILVDDYFADIGDSTAFSGNLSELEPADTLKPGVFFRVTEL